MLLLLLLLCVGIKCIKITENQLVQKKKQKMTENEDEKTTRCKTTTMYDDTIHLYIITYIHSKKKTKAIQTVYSNSNGETQDKKYQENRQNSGKIPVIRFQIGCK